MSVKQSEFHTQPDDTRIPQADDPLHPPLECDVVMKGGVTSGIVYPKALLALRGRYRFRSIGGTSAGAMAAAMAAAAEYGREQGGFEELERLSEELSQDGFLLSLFQASDETQPLFATLLKAARKEERERILHAAKGFTSGAAGVATALAEILKATHGKRYEEGVVAGRSFLWRSLICIALIGGGFGLLGAIGSCVSQGFDKALPAIVVTALLCALFAVVLVRLLARCWLHVPLDQAAAELGGVVVAAKDLANIAITKLPKNDFGMCRGRRTAAGAPGSQGLSEWFSEGINRVAGRDPSGPPLTFGELEAKTGPNGEKWGIEVAMVTTNLSGSAFRSAFRIPRVPFQSG